MPRAARRNGPAPARSPRRSVLVALLLALCVPAEAGAGDAPSVAQRWRELVDEAIDPRDGHLDLSPFLERAAGFLPIPVIVTEPAVGYGGGAVAAVYLQVGSAWLRPQDGTTATPSELTCC